MRANSTKEGNGENENVLNYASRLKGMFSRKRGIKALNSMKNWHFLKNQTASAPSL